MALLHPDALKTVVGLSIHHPETNVTEPAGSGFFYLYAGDDLFSSLSSGRLGTWVVSCKHVVDSATPPSQIWIRANRGLQQGIGHIVTESHEWFRHPVQDVAVLPLSWLELSEWGLEGRLLSQEKWTLTREGVTAAGLSEGDEVFVLGFPIGWREARQHYPIVRGGVLSELHAWLDGDHETFLVDGSGFPGNSGGPVITKPQLIGIEGTKSIDKSHLIGLVRSRQFSPIPNTIHLVETADLIEVVAMDAVHETIRTALVPALPRGNLASAC